MGYDVRTVRQQNLVQLLSAYEGTNTRWAQKHDLNAKVIAQIKNGQRRMGPQIARRIEAALNLADGWMDHDHSRSPLSPRATEVAQRFEALSDGDQAMVWFLIERLAKP